MGGIRGLIRTLYGGRHGRTTALLATSSAAAGAVAGFVGVGVARAPASHDPAATTHHVKAAQPRHSSTSAPALPVRSIRPTRTHSSSPSPTRSKATATATATHSPTPTATPSGSPTPSPTDTASPPPSTSPPG